MNVKESERLIVLEQKQKEMNSNINVLARNLATNTRATLKIQRTLDELTGAKKFMMWFTSTIVGAGVVIATWLGFHHK